MEFCEKKGESGCGTFVQLQGNLQFCASHCCKLDDMEPIGPPPGWTPIVDDERRKVPGPPVDPLPPVDIKHGKKHKKHPEKGLNTVGEEKKTKTRT